MMEQHFRLAAESDDLGLNCQDTGLWLAGIPLLQKTAGGFTPRPVNEISVLMKGVYGQDVDSDGVSRGLNVIANALNRDDLGRAMIAALHLRLSKLSLEGAAHIARIDDALAKYDSSEPETARGAGRPATTQHRIIRHMSDQPSGDQIDPAEQTQPHPVTPQAGKLEAS